MPEGDLSWAIKWVTNWWPYGYIHVLMTNQKELFTSSSAKVKPIESINWNPTYLSYSMQYSKTLLHLTRAHCNQSFCLLCTSLPSTVLYTRYKTTKPIPKGKRRWGDYNLYQVPYYMSSLHHIRRSYTTRITSSIKCS